VLYAPVLGFFVVSVTALLAGWRRPVIAKAALVVAGSVLGVYLVAYVVLSLSALTRGALGLASDIATCAEAVVGALLVVSVLVGEA